MKTYEWHLEDYLDTPEMVVEYLNQVIEDGDQDELVRAIGYLSRAKEIPAGLIGTHPEATTCGNRLLPLVGTE